MIYDFYEGSTPKHTDAMVTFGVQADGTVMPKFDSLSDQQFALEGVSSGIVTSAKVTLAGANIEYNIVGGNKDNEFAIDNSGTIYVNSKVLDREKVPEYNLVVRAAKQGVTPILVVEKTVRISIKDVNDNEPEFNVRGSPEVTIQTNAPIGTVVSMVSLEQCFYQNTFKLKYCTVLYSIVQYQNIRLYLMHICKFSALSYIMPLPIFSCFFSSVHSIKILVIMQN